MTCFVKLKNKERVKLFNKAKEGNNSWKIIYEKLNISRAMFYNYLSGKYEIPKDIFIQLEKISKIKIDNYKENYKSNYLKKEIKEIKINNNLSEILGILNGDGYISATNHEICVAGNSQEIDHFEYMKKLFENTFGLNFKIYSKKNSMRLKCYSKKLADLLHHEFGVPKGRKLGKLKIPKQIFGSKKYLESYIRGLFDTDGSTYIRRKKDLVVEIISKDKRYLSEVKAALNSLGFICGISGKNLYIYDKSMIHKFFKVIQPANAKHLMKFKNYNRSTGDLMVRSLQNKLTN